MVVVVRVGGPTRVDVEMGYREVAADAGADDSYTSWRRARWRCLR